MCFSAQASYLSATLLTLISIVTLKQVKKSSHYFFASIPLLFAVQQFAEGIVWTSGSIPAAYIFLFFALLVWPLWIPLSIAQLENNHVRKKLIWLCVVIGVMWSTLCAIGLITYGVDVQRNQHIYYSFTSPVLFSNAYFSALLYCIPVLLPFFISSNRYMPWFGLLLAASCVITLAFWASFFTSVWCFFAALLSIAVLIIMPLIH